MIKKKFIRTFIRQYKIERKKIISKDYEQGALNIKKYYAIARL